MVTTQHYNDKKLIEKVIHALSLLEMPVKAESL